MSAQGVVIHKNYNPERTSENSWERRKTSKIIWHHPKNNWGPIIDDLVLFEEDFNSWTEMWSGPDGYLRPDQFLDNLTVIIREQYSNIATLFLTFLKLEKVEFFWVNQQSNYKPTMQPTNKLTNHQQANIRNFTTNKKYFSQFANLQLREGFQKT